MTAAKETEEAHAGFRALVQLLAVRIEEALRGPALIRRSLDADGARVSVTCRRLEPESEEGR